MFFRRQKSVGITKNPLLIKGFQFISRKNGHRKYKLTDLFVCRKFLIEILSEIICGKFPTCNFRRKFQTYIFSRKFPKNTFRRSFLGNFPQILSDGISVKNLPWISSNGFGGRKFLMDHFRRIVSSQISVRKYIFCK